jgi:hypothetical protein
MAQIVIVSILFILFLLAYAIPVAYKASRDGTSYSFHIFMLSMSMLAAFISSLYSDIGGNHLMAFIIFNYFWTVIFYLFFTKTGWVVIITFILFGWVAEIFKGLK